ncbi:RrF2 family transcriptional regulator [Croceicoccus marinus]|uniref:Rrf2 family transcriptional regulator n=1 Tax=Croceicoccus marinus TaxID=450378 RepID=A0A217EZ02_9SPHN|nr:Rrf2 family transcriptional regulator [Croceicoccus marinus]ARU18366.1 Rrf2 family transcriptional regulator [Croceicoccus marinus]
MRLTRYTDYGLRVLLYLAERPDTLPSIAAMAEFHKISRNHLMKVVHDLGRAGFVSTVRGRLGGVRLARPPGEINVGAVVRRMEDDFHIVDCPSCRIAGHCGLRGALGEALAAFLAVLDGYTVADLVAKQPGPQALFPELDEATDPFG